MPPKPTAPWPTLATDQQKKAILPILDALAKTVGKACEENHPSLAGGLSGRALFLGYLSRLPGNADQAQQAMTVLSQAVDRVGEVYGSALYGGYAGIAWAVEHLQREIFTPAGFPVEEEDGNEGVDEVLLDLLSMDTWQGDYDLISGLVGYGVYALERLDKPTAKAVLLRTLFHLEKLAVKRAVGVSWPTAPDLISPWQREIAPNGYFNLGLAHGMPAVLLLLAAMHKAGIAPERCKPLVEGGVVWLLSQFQPASVGSYLGAWCQMEHEKETETRAGRIAWCYGDLGASLALWQVGHLMARPDWQAKALDMARLAAARPLDDSGIRDVSLCHGSAGNMVIFMRHYHNTGEQAFWDTAQKYLAHLIETRSPDLPYAGYTYFSPPQDDENAANPYQSQPGLLEGASGAGMGLLAALGVEPTWDRFMMLSTTV